MPVRCVKASTSRWRTSASGRETMLLRLERVRGLAQLPVEIDDPGEEVIEAAADELAVAGRARTDTPVSEQLA